MKKLPAVLVWILVLAGSFSVAEAAPTWTLTATCNTATNELTYVSNGTGSRYYMVYQGIVGNSDQMNASLSSLDTFGQTNTCDDWDDSVDPTKVHINSYWFAAVVPAANQAAWNTYFTTGGSIPSGDYGLTLCDTPGCLSLINLTIGTSSAMGYFQNASATSTIDLIGEQCSQSGNFFSYGICVSFAYLFVPSSEILNEWGNIASTTQQKFPFSWVAQTKAVVTGLSATTSTSTPTYSYGLHDLGIGSTTAIGNLMPNMTILSKATIMTYMSPTVWNAVQALIAAGLWLVFGFDVYTTVRRRHAHV